MDYVDALLAVDFSLPCAQMAFCSLCLGAVCLKCCPAHVPSQHGIEGGARKTIDVTLLEGTFPAVSASSVRTGGLGYDWKMIQRVQHKGTKWVMLGRHQPNGRLKGSCDNCGDLIPAGALYCSPRCKVAFVPQAQRVEVIQSLVECDFSRHPFLDRFCTGCRRAFSSSFCQDHGHHHAAGENFEVFIVRRHDGWESLIPLDQLPDVLTNGVKRVLAEDGTVCVSVHPRELANSHAPRQCVRCQEEVGADDVSCSIWCKGEYE